MTVYTWGCSPLFAAGDVGQDHHYVQSSGSAGPSMLPRCWVQPVSWRGNPSPQPNTGATPSQEPQGRTERGSTLLPIDHHKCISLWKGTNCSTVCLAKAAPVWPPGATGTLLTMLASPSDLSLPLLHNLHTCLSAPGSSGTGQRLPNTLIRTVVKAENGDAEIKTMMSAPRSQST